MNEELLKRIITSIILIFLLIAAFLYDYILIILLITFSTISWIEFNILISKIFDQQIVINRSKIFGLKLISLLYLFLFSILVFYEVNKIEFNSHINIIFLFLICIFSDIGGLIFGKIFKGKKLTKISPNKTISGSIGSFFLSISIGLIFYYAISEKNNFINLIILSFLVSFICQMGDLFISYLKRIAKVKDTGNLLPGHGGVLDRIDGILFAIPAGIILMKFLII
jgi:phosphatidate cytidylyltransferase